MMSRLAQGTLLYAILAPGAAWAAEPLPLTVTPVSGTEVIAGRSFTLRVDTEAPIGSMKVNVSARWQALEQRGAPPLEFTVQVPWDETGSYSVGVEAQSYDPATDARWYGSQDIDLFAKPDPGEVPVELYMHPWLHLAAPVSGQAGETGSIRPFAVHADRERRSVELGAFGTRYRTSNPEIATVDADGQVTAMSPGIAYIEVEYLGVRGLVEVSIEDPATGRRPLIEYTDQVVLNTSGFRRDPDSGLYVQEVSFTNRTEWPIPQPIYLVMTDLTEGVEVKNSVGRADKVEPLGSPVQDVDIPDGPSWLAPGATGTAVLRFRNWQNLPITYKLRLFGASPP